MTSRDLEIDNFNESLHRLPLIDHSLNHGSILQQCRHLYRPAMSAQAFRVFWSLVKYDSYWRCIPVLTIRFEHTEG